MIATIWTIANVSRTDALAGRTDLDSHADQCIVGLNSLMTHDYPYDPRGLDQLDALTRA